MSDIEYSFPSHRAKILKYKAALRTTQSVNGRAFIKSFVHYIDPYYDYIMDCDETHFLKKSPEELGIKGETAKMCEIIKEIWNDPGTSITTKAKVWKYIQDLLKLGRCICT